MPVPVSFRASAVLLLGLTATSAAAQSSSGKSAGAVVYESACAACHGSDGKGVSRETAGHAWPLPDFTDCRFASPERRDDWTVITREGGPVRAFNRAMPAFGDALSSAEIEAAVSHLRAFCTAPAWPAGDLNFPRPLATEKAFPENEAVLVAAAPLRERDNSETRLIYERRLGARGQVEAVVPFTTRRINETWHRGLGDVALGYKHALVVRGGTIVSGSAGLTLPTGKEQYGLGSRLVVFEPSALVGRRFTSALFAHAQVGFELPLNVASTPNEMFWRAAVGSTLNGARAGRAWTPMIELTGRREFEYGDPIRWDLLPELQVTLSRRQHISLTGGVRAAIAGPSRPASAMLSLTWDWFEGGFLSGW